MSHLSSLQPGQRIGGGRFALVKLLGRGGMGVVWLAQDERLGEAVALKFLPPEIRADLGALDDLRRETLKSRKLSHPHIVRIHDLHEVEGEPPFISMEYVEGSTLTAWRVQQDQRVLSWEQLQPLVQQLCEALDYAHGEKVIHRDLKPSNLMLDSKGRLKLADFGIAAVVSDSVSRVSAQRTSGTLAYMSPQQLEGRRAQVTDDIYALGATLYELLTSKPPFYTGDITHQVLHVAPQSLEERLADLGLANDIPPDVAALVMACLAKDPAHRPQSAQAVAEWVGLKAVAEPGAQHLAAEVSADSEAFVERAPAEVEAVREEKGPSYLWKKLIMWEAAIAALLLLGIGAWYLSDHRPIKKATRQAGSSALQSAAGRRPWSRGTVSQPPKEEPQSQPPVQSAMGGLMWLTDLAAAQQKARTEGKALLLSSGLDTCEACARTRNEVLPSAAFGDFARDHLVLASPPPAAYQAVVGQLKVGGTCGLLALSSQGDQVLELPFKPGGAEALVGRLDEFVYEPSDLYWYHNFDVALAKAKAAKKLLVVHHSVDTCEGCIPLIQGLYTQPRFADYAKKNLVLAKVGFPPSDKAVQQQCQIKGCCEATVLSSEGKWLWETYWDEIKKKGGLPWVLSRLDQSRSSAAAVPPAAGSSALQTITVSGEHQCAACLLKLTKTCQSAIQVRSAERTETYLLRQDSLVEDSSARLGVNRCAAAWPVNAVLLATPVETNASGLPVFAATRLETQGKRPFTVQGDAQCLKCLLKKSSKCQLIINADLGGWKQPYHLESTPQVLNPPVNWCEAGHLAKATLTSPAAQKDENGHWLFTPSNLEFLR